MKEISWENKLSHNGILYSRYIASWVHEGGKTYRGGLFESWLRDVQKLTDDEISDIFRIINDGKLELEISACRYLKEHKKEADQENEIFNADHKIFNDTNGTHMRILKDLFIDV